MYLQARTERGGENKDGAAMTTLSGVCVCVYLE